VAHPDRRDLESALALENATERKLAVVSLIDQLVQRIDWRAIEKRKACRRPWSSLSASHNGRVEVRTSLHTSSKRSRSGSVTGDNPIVRQIRFSDSLAGRDEARKRLEPIRRAFGVYRRERPRDLEKARLLRERGTPEHLIGPERADDGST
jgi:hypothetical protein